MPHDYARYRVNEALIPSLPPSLRGLGLSIQTVRFLDGDGNIITSIACGKPYSFEVVGYSAVRLVILKNGVVEFDSAYAVPMSPYSAVCPSEAGNYEAIAYDLSSGAEIGRTTLTITGSWLTTKTLLMIGGALLLLRRRK